MDRFASMYAAIDATTSTNAKVDAMAAYFGSAPPEDAAWAVFFLVGNRLKRHLPSKVLVEWALDAAQIPGWMLEECWSEVGDFAEIVALLVADPAASGPTLSLAAWMSGRVLPLRDLDPQAQRDQLFAWARELDHERLFLLLKLLTGEFRVGVSRTLVIRALAKVAGVDDAVVAHRLMGTWEPTAETFARFVAQDSQDADRSRPYPFFLASPLDAPAETLGERSDWQAEWKWDGIRCQLVKRAGEVFLWSRGEELVTARFPEITEAADRLPDCVLDGEAMAWRDGPLPFAVMQTRIGRTKLTKKALEAAPIAFVAYDLLEVDGTDVRTQPLRERRARLETLVTAAGPPLHLSPVVDAPTWDALATLRTEARARNVEGLMLKQLDAPYRVGRKRGEWWKWKIDPYSIDAVLTYAQPGSGKRASLLTDYTFGVWSEGELVSFAKAYTGLDQAEIAELDGWIRRHTLERFGPVRRVEPVHVFELAFEGIQRSTRHKSGVAVRFPRIARWRRDKPASEANTLADVLALAELQPN
jgi:DNA ligase-1